MMQIEKEHKKSTLMTRSKKELVEHIMWLEHNNNALNDTINTQAENFIKLARWIPVSERLPEERKTYICTVLRFNDNYIYSGELIYYPEDDTWAWYDDPITLELNYKTHRILAWMPLPEPYKPDDECQGKG